MDSHIVVDYFIDETRKWVIIFPSSWMNEERTQCLIPHEKGAELKSFCNAKSQPQGEWTCYFMQLRKSYCKFHLITLTYI
jgi:hypothetical protein